MSSSIQPLLCKQDEFILKSLQSASTSPERLKNHKKNLEFYESKDRRLLQAEAEHWVSRHKVVKKCSLLTYCSQIDRQWQIF